jgi:hypothetical protein
MKESSPSHTHHVHMMEKMEDGGHVHHHNMYGEHKASHMKEHEKVKALCGGGMSRK